VEVVGNRLVVQLGERAFLGPDNAREVAEVVDGQRQVGGQALPDRLAVVPGLGDGQGFQVGLYPVGDLVQDVGPLGGAGPSPAALGAVRRVERASAGVAAVLGLAPRDEGK